MPTPGSSPSPGPVTPGAGRSETWARDVGEGILDTSPGHRRTALRMCLAPSGHAWALRAQTRAACGPLGDARPLQKLLSSELLNPREMKCSQKEER